MACGEATHACVLTVQMPKLDPSVCDEQHVRFTQRRVQLLRWESWQSKCGQNTNVLIPAVASQLGTAGHKGWMKLGTDTYCKAKWSGTGRQAGSQPSYGHCPIVKYNGSKRASLRYIPFCVGDTWIKAARKWRNRGDWLLFCHRTFRR